MKKYAIIIIGVLLVLGLVGLLVMAVAGASYKGLVRLAQGADSQWAQVENVYQRRADLIPNLVATVSGAANFEKSTLTEITAARASVWMRTQRTLANSSVRSVSIDVIFMLYPPVVQLGREA